MADIQSQLPVKLTDNVNTVAIVGTALKIDGSAVTQPVSGTVTLSSQTVTLSSQTVTVSNPSVTIAATSVTQPVSGTVTLSSQTVTTTPTGTQSVTGTGTAGAAAAGVISIQGIASMTAVKVDGSAVTQPVSGTVTLSSQTVTLSSQTVTVGNNPSVTIAATSVTQPVSGTVTNVPSGTQSVTGTGIAGTAAAGVISIQGIASMTAVKVDGSAVTQPVSGTVTLSSQTVTLSSQTVTIGATSVTQPVSGTVTLSSNTVTLSSQTVTVGNSPSVTIAATSVTQPVSGTVSTTTGVVSTGIVNSYGTQASVANAATGTISYTVTAAKTLYLKGVIASSSGGPCKVVVDSGAGTTTYAVGFYSASLPFVSLVFQQPVSFAAAAVLSVKIQNNAGAAQDVYATIMGQEV